MNISSSLAMATIFLFIQNYSTPWDSFLLGDQIFFDRRWEAEFHHLLTAAVEPLTTRYGMRLQPASRHDAVSLVVSSVEFKQRFTLAVCEWLSSNQKIILSSVNPKGKVIFIAN
ncbi:MAG: hypothetical protein ACYCVD_00530 [Desulfitobacteriaceae bacterium]